MKVRHIAYIAMAALAVAFFLNRKVPTSQKAQQTAAQTALQQSTPPPP